MWDAVRDEDVAGVILRRNLANFTLLLRNAVAADAALFAVAGHDVVAIDLDAVTGPIYRVDVLLRGTPVADEWPHAPDCDGHDQHESPPAELAPVADGRRDRSGGPGGSGLNGFGNFPPRGGASGNSSGRTGRSTGVDELPGLVSAADAPPPPPPAAPAASSTGGDRGVVVDTGNGNFTSCGCNP